MHIVGDDTMELVIILILILSVLGFFGWFFCYQKSLTKQGQRKKDLRYYESVPTRYMIDMNPVSLEEIQKKDPSFEVSYFLFVIFCMFRHIQQAWSNNQSELIQHMIGDSLKEPYQKALKSFIAQGQRNMIYDITPVESRLISFSYDATREEAVVLLTVICYDYLVAVSSQRVIAGSTEHKMMITYLLTVERKLPIKKEEGILCDHCGQMILTPHTIRCPYCNNELVPNIDWILTGKEILASREVE